MGYSKSRRTVIRMQPFLDQILQSQENLVIPAANPRKFAYKIREALHAASFHPDLAFYHEQIKPHFEFAEHKKGVLVKRIGGGFVPKSVGVGFEPVTIAERKPMEKHLPEATTLTEIIGAAIKFSKNPILVFPSALLSDTSLAQLKTWAETEGWEVKEEEEGSELTLLKTKGG